MIRIAQAVFGFVLLVAFGVIGGVLWIIWTS